MGVNIRVENDDEFNLLMKMLEKKGYEWLSGKKPTEHNDRSILWSKDWVCVHNTVDRKYISADISFNFKNLTTIEFIQQSNNF